MKIIKVTQELKDKVKDVFDSYEVGAIVSIRLPKRIVLIEDGVSTTYEGFDKREDLQTILGFKELPTKPILAENEVLTNSFIEVDNEFQYEIRTLTVEEIDEAVKTKLESYRTNIYSITEKLNDSAKARSLGKQGQGLTIVQLRRLELVYIEKNELATQYLLDGTILDEVSFSTIIFESENDFTPLELDETIIYLNATYSFGIPETGLTIIQQYCHIIVSKFILGSQLDKIYNSFIEAFRSKLITNIDKGEYDKADERIALVATITNETTLDDILVLKDQFYAI